MMRKILLCLALILLAGGASAQHHHGGGTPEAFTATPAFAPDGTLWLVRAMTDRIVVRKSTEQRRTVSDPVAVAPDAMKLDWGADARPHIAVERKGGLIVTFAIFQDQRFHGRACFSRSTDHSASFSRPQP